MMTALNYLDLTSETLCMMRKRVELAIKRLEENTSRSWEQELALEGYQQILGDVMAEQDRRKEDTE